MNNRTRAPMEMMHKKVVRDIAKAVDHAYYGASIENVSYSETSEAITLKHQLFKIKEIKKYE